MMQYICKAVLWKFQRALKLYTYFIFCYFLINIINWFELRIFFADFTTTRGCHGWIPRGEWLWSLTNGWLFLRQSSLEWLWGWSPRRQFSPKCFSAGKSVKSNKIENRTSACTIFWVWMMNDNDITLNECWSVDKACCAVIICVFIMSIFKNMWLLSWILLPNSALYIIILVNKSSFQ